MFAYGTATGSEPVRQEVRMGGAVNSVQAGGVTIERLNAVGEYEVHFAALATPEPFGDPDQEGVVQVRALGPADGACQVGTNLTDDGRGGVLAFVDCSDAAGNPANRPFGISYTRGGADKGSLVTFRQASDPDGSNLLQQSNQEVTLGGVLQSFANPDTRAQVDRTGVGAYTFETPLLPGSGPSTVQLSPMLPAFPRNGQRGAVCGVLSVATVNSGVQGRGLIKQIKVQCRGPGGFGPVDVPVALSFSKGVNPLGSSRLTTAIVSAPKLTKSAVLSASQVFNQNLQLTGAAVVVRNTPGQYLVLLDNQQAHLGGDNVSVTADGSTADCHITGTTQDLNNKQERIAFACTDAWGKLVDTAFRMQYTAVPVLFGRLELSPRKLKARAGRTAKVRLGWTHPRSWKDLKTVELRLYRAAKQVGRVNVRPASREVSDAGAVSVVRGATKVQRKGKTVTARLALRFAPKLAGARLRVDVCARDKQGRVQVEERAGKVTVAR